VQIGKREREAASFKSKGRKEGRKEGVVPVGAVVEWVLKQVDPMRE
jgi:hypothetical protein